MANNLVQPCTQREITLIQYLLSLHDKAALQILHLSKFNKLHKCKWHLTDKKKWFHNLFWHNPYYKTNDR